jgi:hypothetical protein
MSATASKSTTLTWVALLALTCGSYALSEWESTPAMLFGLAWIKLALITAVFMELKHSRPLFLRSALALYTLTLAVIVMVS